MDLEALANEYLENAVRIKRVIAESEKRLKNERISVSEAFRLRREIIIMEDIYGEQRSIAMHLKQYGGGGK